MYKQNGRCAFAYFQVAAMKGMKFDNPQSASLSKVVADCQTLKYMLVKVKDSTPNATELEQVRSCGTQCANAIFACRYQRFDVFACFPQDEVLKSARGKSMEDKLFNMWQQLQVHVNGVIDSDLDKMNADRLPGIKQVRSPSYNCAEIVGRLPKHNES